MKPAFLRIVNGEHRIFVTYRTYPARIQNPRTKVREMRKLPIAIALAVATLAAANLLGAACTPASAQDAPAFADSEAPAKPARISAFRAAMSEVAILRYRAALKLKAHQEQYWPAVANALRVLAREPEVNEAAVRRFVPAASALFASLDDSQKQTAMRLVQRTGLTQYAALF